MPNNTAYTYWSLLQELNNDSSSTVVQNILNSNSNLSDTQIEQLRQDPRVSALFMVDPLFAGNPELQKEFIQNFPYARLRNFNQVQDQKLIQNQLVNYYLEFAKTNVSETISDLQVASDIKSQAGLQSTNTNLQEQSGLDSMDPSAEPQAENLQLNSSIDPNQNFTADSNIDEDTQLEDEINLKSKTKVTPGEITQNEVPFVQNENQENTNNYSLNNPSSNSNPSPKLEDSIVKNKEQLSKKEQNRIQRLQKRGIQARQQASTFGTNRKQAPKMSLLKKGILAGAFSTVTAGSGLTLFQILFT